MNAFPAINVMFYDEVKNIHDVTTANPFPYSA